MGDLRVDDLQPGTYAACVRCVAPCGCESACSPWAFLPFTGPPQCRMPNNVAPASNMRPSMAPASDVVLIPDLCPPPAHPPSLPMTSVAATAHMRSAEDGSNAELICTGDALTLD